MQIVGGQVGDHIQQSVQHTVIWQVAVAGSLSHSRCSCIQRGDPSAWWRIYARVCHAALQLLCCGQSAVDEEAQRLQLCQVVEAERNLDSVEAEGDDALHLGLEILAEAAGAVQQTIKHGVAAVKAGPGDTNEVHSNALGPNDAGVDSRQATGGGNSSGQGCSRPPSVLVMKRTKCTMYLTCRDMNASRQYTVCSMTNCWMDGTGLQA